VATAVKPTRTRIPDISSFFVREEVAAYKGRLADTNCCTGASDCSSQELTILVKSTERCRAVVGSAVSRIDERPKTGRLVRSRGQTRGDAPVNWRLRAMVAPSRTATFIGAQIRHRFLEEHAIAPPGGRANESFLSAR